MLEYALEHGSYYLYDMSQPISRLTGRREVRSMSDEVALLFDQESGTLYKHGRPDTVQREHAKLRQANIPGVVEQLVLITGTFPVDELNRCLNTTGYVRTFFHRLQQGDISSGKPAMSPVKASLLVVEKPSKPGPFVRATRTT